MIDKHATRDGHTVLIGQMDDEHLINTILLFIKKAESVKSAGQALETESDDYTKHLYGIRGIDPKEAAEVNKKAIRHLYPYICEAYLRGLSDPLEPLRSLVGRSGQIGAATPVLSSGLEWNEEDF